MSSFSRRIQQLMEDTGASSFQELSEFSQRKGKAHKISKSSLYRWSENDQVSMRSAKRLATAFDLNWRWVFKGTPPMRTDSHQAETAPTAESDPVNETDNTLRLRLRLHKAVYHHHEWEIDLIKDTYTFQKLLIDPNAHISEMVTIPLDDLFDHIIEEDHGLVLESISDCIHDLDNTVYSINYRYKTADGIKTRHSFAMAEFDDFTRAVKIIGVSSTSNSQKPTKNANQLELLQEE